MMGKKSRWIFAFSALGVLLLVTPNILPAATSAPFGFKNVVAKAKKLSETPYQAPGKVPDWLEHVTYDEWRDIRFRPEQALWRDRGLRFEVQFFHPGAYFNHPVLINTIDAAGVHPVRFSPSQFDYGKNKFASKVPQDLGYAGFRVHYPINKPDYKDEVLVFLGASYFRALGRNEVYGASARGLAIDTGLPEGEEFPSFKEFWLVRPTAGAKSIRIYALLDSPSASGAYNFVLAPGRQTVLKVEARVFIRRKIEELGLAPLTSMFFFGENTLDPPVDYRPEVHDSDGLLLAAKTGEWIWRPLINPKKLNMSDFEMTNPVGFGLLQRDRNFDHYQDLETRPDLRPSVWITPEGHWGKGKVELVEIPSPKESNDNIVVFWVPAQPIQPGQKLTLSYTQFWYSKDPTRPPGGRTQATRIDRGTFDNAYRFVIDFTGGRLQKLSADTVLRGVVTIGAGNGKEGEVLEQQVEKNPVTGGWRLIFQMRPHTDAPIELRAFLTKGKDALTETWSYVLFP